MMLCGSFIFLVILKFVSCQENAGTNVAPSLQRCYNTTRYATRDYRPPSTIAVLVELIRKIEDGNPNQDARELSFQILHRFRQDGIKRTVKEIDISQGLPYSPKGVESYKNRLQLTKITPGNAVNFNNDSLSSMQACSLHYMVSSTIEVQARPNEKCSGVRARYTSRVHKRQTELTETEPFARSSCPIESGVISTKWGVVKAGLLMAGIASGYQPNPMKVGSTTLESAYASTIAGELSEAALNQLTAEKTVGNKGAWNSTIQPKYWFLDSNERDNLYLTDAEIRGGLDGLFLGLNIQDWKSTSSNLKISQILDLYYSRGVFNNSARACNRKTLTKDIIQSTKLVDQTVAFSKLLDGVSQLQYTPKEENLPTMAQTITSRLKTYVDSQLSDLDCSAESDLIERVSTDVLIFIDTSWDYKVIQPFISYLLENLDTNKYESSYTIYDGSNCEIIVNKSRSILDYHEQFNLTQIQKYPTGFDYNKVIQTAERVFKAKLNNETDLTGQSTLVLMLPHNTPSASQSDYVQSRRNDYKSYLPDLRILVGGSGSKSSYNSLVTNPTSDIVEIAEGTNDDSLKTSATNLIDRFKKLPRSVVNPSCGSSFSGEHGNFEVYQYVEPSGINYHKISPNYFYDGQSLKIRGQGYGSLTVCTSRTDANPQNTTSGANCKSIVSDEISIDISGYCTDDVINCSPIYISVQGGESSNRCSDAACRFPDNIKYSIYLENVQCSSSSEKLVTTFLLVFLLFTIINF